MSTFNDRENAFENKFAHDEEMMFKAKPARKIVRARPVKAAKDAVRLCAEGQTACGLARQSRVAQRSRRGLWLALASAYTKPASSLSRYLQMFSR